MTIQDKAAIGHCSLTAILAMVVLGAGCRPQRAGRDLSQATTVLRATASPAAGPEHPYREVLRRYIRGCNSGDAAMVRSTLAEDVVVYFLNLPPIAGRDAVASAWKQYHDATHSRWTIDAVVIDGPEAVMEWSALRELAPGSLRLDRGIDWYVFKDGLIAEIRQYYDPRGLLAADRTYEQMGFPYGERGYPTAATLDSQLP